MVLGASQQPQATYADLAALPPNLVGEIINGRLIASPRPGLPHAQSASGLGILIGGPYQYGLGGPGGWIILDEPELHLGSDVVVPDLASWRRERMPRVPQQAFCELAPDWICEVISPSSSHLDRGEKLTICLRERVGHVWLLDPAPGTLEVLRHTTDGYLIVAVHVAPAKVRAEPFDGVELDLGLLLGE